MNVSCQSIFNNLCRTLYENSDYTNQCDLSEKFGALTSNCERVDFMYGLLEDYDCFPNVVVEGKDNAVSVKFRTEGNRIYKQGTDDKEAVLLYTKAVAYAPCNSEELALAYANRSAVLFREKFYVECLVDIQRALENKYPAELQKKLITREEAAKAKISKLEQEKYHEFVPKLKSKHNDVIECASDSISIEFDENFGRHVVAAKDIDVGEVLAIERPYAKVLLGDYYQTHCHHCLHPCYNMIACEICPVVLYCGNDCQRNAWAHYHKYECPILLTLMNLELNKLTLVALRICISAKNEYDNVGRYIETESNCPISVYKSENYEEVHNLVTNSDLRVVSDLIERSCTAAIILHLVQRHTAFFEGVPEGTLMRNLIKDMILIHLQTGPSNFHEISELARSSGNIYEPAEIGAGVYAFLSLLNHGCSPNVIRHCYGDSIVLRSLRPIRKGEQLLDNYGYHHAVMPKKDRQELLKKQYYFDCRCEACENNWPMYEDLIEKNFDLGISGLEITSLREGSSETAKALLEKLLKNGRALEKLRPCKEQADFQEIIKQCFAILANKKV